MTSCLLKTCLQYYQQSHISDYYKFTIAIRLHFGFDLTTTKNEHVHFFVTLRGIVANKKAVVGPYNDVIVYVTLIRMAFTLTDQHRVGLASFDCQRWYSPFTYFRSKMSSYMNSCLLTYIVLPQYPLGHFLWRVESKSNRNCNSRYTQTVGQCLRITARSHIFHPLQYGADNSSPAFSIPVFWMVPHFPVPHFQLCMLDKEIYRAGMSF